MAKILSISIIIMLLSSPILVFAQNNDINHKIAFDITETNVTTNLASHGGVPFYFEFDRSFSEPNNDAYYELFKVIDSRNNQYIGDLRIYVGSSQWWNANASLQEDDTTGYDNIIKIKLFVIHLTDPTKIEDVSNSLSHTLTVLVPEWSNETANVSSNDWFFDSINNSQRNEGDKRENKIIVSDKTIRVFHDDVGFGSMTLIVTENLDVTFKNYVLEEKKILDELLDVNSQENSNNNPQEIKCGEETVLKNGKCIPKEWQTNKGSIKKENDSTNTATGTFVVLGIIVILIGLFVINRKIKKNKIQKIKDAEWKRNK